MSIAESGVNGRLAWFTSSYSNGAGGECVQCALAVGGAWVRDSKQAGVLWSPLESELGSPSSMP